MSVGNNKQLVFLGEDDTQTQLELTEQLNMTQKAVSLRLKVMGKVQKVRK